MQYCTLGRSNLSVSRVALGCWAFAGGPYWGDRDEKQSIEIIRAALDWGVNFFDTAEGYGSGYSEEIVGKALVGRRQEVVIATKASSSHLAYEDLLQACEASLRRLQTDYIDLYQIHWPNRNVPLEETMRALEHLRDQGKICAIGVSNFGVGDLTDLLRVGRAESNQLPYSLLWRAIEYEIQPKCVENDISILCYSPLAQGLLTGRYTKPDEVPEGRARSRWFSSRRPLARHGEPGCETETFRAIRRIRQIADELGQPMARLGLAWLLHQPGVASVLAGAGRIEHLQSNVQAASLSLSPDIIERLAQATDDLKARLGPNPDMWQSEAESRYR